MRWIDHLRVFALFGLVWIVLLYWSLRKPVQKRNGDNLRELNRRLIKAVESVEKLRAGNAELDVQLAASNLKFSIQRTNSTSNRIHMDTLNPTLIAPSEDYELLRRRIFLNAKEFSYYVDDQLKSLIKKEKGLMRRIYKIKNMAGEHFRSLLKDISNLADVDDHSIWRQQESENLSRLVQGRLNRLQNPPNCSAAKQLVCDFGKDCGFCCKLHHLVYCFIVAYETQRTLVLEPTNYNAGVWPDFLIPLSNTCPLVTNQSIFKWTGGSQTDQTVYLPIVEEVYPKPRLLPPVLPGDFAPRLNVLHGDPMVWWIGQFLKFILRPHPTISKQLVDYAKKMNFQKPYVGVHIRRSDKINEEALFHGLEEYMIRVEEYYKLKELSGRIYKKRIYLATDEPSLLIEARQKYPEYEIIGDQEISKKAFKRFRNSKESLIGLIVDIHFLSLSNYLVCTFSSQVCRVAYELMNSLHPDASTWYSSLDDIYYFGGQNYKLNEAVLEHKTRRSHEINLRVGDQIFVHGNHWNGYSKGKNLRTKKVGLYPTFKAISKIESAIFHAYSNRTV